MACSGYSRPVLSLYSFSFHRAVCIDLFWSICYSQAWPGRHPTADTPCVHHRTVWQEVYSSSMWTLPLYGSISRPSGVVMGVGCSWSVRSGWHWRCFTADTCDSAWWVWSHSASCRVLSQCCTIITGQWLSQVYLNSCFLLAVPTLWLTYKKSENMMPHSPHKQAHDRNQN